MQNIIHLDSIYVLILNYQSYKDTIDYISILQKQQEIDLNILVVDNCSPNESYNILHTEYKNTRNVEVIKSERNGGYAYGNNFGLHYLEKKDFDYILISNNDISIDDDLLLNKLINQYTHLQKPAFISPLMYVAGKASSDPAWKIPTVKSDIIYSLRLFRAIFSHKKNIYSESNKENIKVECVPGSFFLSKKNIFYDIGLMDENTFLYMEESILGFKIKEKGLNNYLITALQYEHYDSKTIANEMSLLRMGKYLLDSRIYFHKKYLHTNNFFIQVLILLFSLWKIETYLHIRIKRFFRK